MNEPTSADSKDAKPAPFTPRLIDDLLDRAAREWGDRPALVGTDTPLNYRQFRDRVDNVAAALQGLGVAPGDRVAVLDKNSHAYLELYFALPRIGAVAVPLNYRLAPRELAYIVADSTAKTLIYGAEYATAANELRNEVKTLSNFVCMHESDETRDDVTDHDYAAWSAGGRARPEPVERETDDVFLQMYTSGTTGRPKGAMLTHANLIANTLTTAYERDYTHADTYLHVCPLYHVADLELFFGMTYSGAANAILREFSPPAFLEAVQCAGVTVVFLVPAIINFLLEDPAFDDYEISTLRLIVYGGSAIPEACLRMALARLKCSLAQGYGLTETSPVLCVLPPADHRLDGPHAARIKSCGRAAYGVEVKTVREDGKPCEEGEVGEIVARGANIMRGYWRMPEATTAAIRNGWFHTGDLAYRDAHGYFYIVDRKKDMIVTGAENVYPREVEEVLYRHPSVLDAAVLGVPSARWGEAVKAVVVARDGHDIAEDALIEFCRGELAGYKVPRSVDIVDELPRNPSGKVLKRVLREKYWANESRRVN